MTRGLFLATVTILAVLVAIWRWVHITRVGWFRRQSHRSWARSFEHDALRDPCWLAVGFVPTISRFRLAGQFHADGGIELYGDHIRLSRSNKVVLSTPVRQLAVKYDQIGGAFIFVVEGNAYVVSFADPFWWIWPGGLSRKSWKWLKVLRSAGANVQKRSTMYWSR